MKVQRSLAALAAVSVIPIATAQTFPGAGTDTTTSLGMFKIEVAPAFRSLFQMYIGSQIPGTYSGNVYTSPLLSDNGTQISRSDPFIVNGSQTESVSTPNGPLTVTTGNAVVPPSFGAIANGQRAVATDMFGFNLSSGNISVTAGNGVTGAYSQVDQGEVVSNQTPANDPGPNYANDFPAKSFFDIFVDVNITTTIPGIGDIQLENTKPLLVMQSSIDGFPPKVIYTHDAAQGWVPIYIEAPGSPMNGDILGDFIVAGHGAGYNMNNPQDVQAFQNAFNALPDAMPEPPAWMVLPVGLGLFAFARRRRK